MRLPGGGERGCPGETDLRLYDETQGGGRSRRPRHSLWCDGRSSGARRAAPARRSWRLQPARCRLRKVRAAARVGERHRGSRRELRPGKGAGSAPHKDEARPAALSCFPRPGGNGTVFPAGGCGAERYHRGRGGRSREGARGRSGEGLSAPPPRPPRCAPSPCARPGRGCEAGRRHRRFSGVWGALGAPGLAGHRWLPHL